MTRMTVAATLLSLLASCSLLSMGEPPETPDKSAVGPALDAVLVLVDPSNLRAYCSAVIHRDLALTAAHCVADEVETSVYALHRSDKNTLIELEVLYYDAVNDMAALRGVVRQLSGGRPLASVGPVHGESVVVVGHPYGLRWSISTGVVSHPHRVGGPRPGAHWTQISAPITYGNSGGPVYNRFGEILGLSSFFIAGERHLAGIVHISQLRKAVADVYAAE